MISTLAKFDKNALAKTYDSIMDTGNEFSYRQKRTVGQVGLLLNEVEALDVDVFSACIENNDMAGLQEEIRQALGVAKESILAEFNLESNDLALDFVRNGDDVSLSISKDMQGYDISGLNYLSAKDARIVATVIAFVRDYLILAPTPTDIVQMSDGHSEDLDTFQNWLPESVRFSPKKVMNYCNKNEDKFDDVEIYYFEDFDLIRDAYIESIQPKPKWYQYLSLSRQSQCPKIQLGQLTKKVNSISNRKVRRDVMTVIDLVSRYLAGFSSQKEIEDFTTWFYESDREVGRDGYELDVSYAMTIGSDGIEYQILSDMYRHTMEAAETPSYHLDLSSYTSRKNAKRVLERLFLGDVAMQTMTELLNDIVIKLASQQEAA